MECGPEVPIAVDSTPGETQAAPNAGVEVATDIVDVGKIVAKQFIKEATSDLIPAGVNLQSQEPIVKKVAVPAPVPTPALEPIKTTPTIQTNTKLP